MELEIVEPLNYWDGPIEFIGRLDGARVYVVCREPQADNRTFDYWFLGSGEPGSFDPAAELPAADGTFTSEDVEWEA